MRERVKIDKTLSLTIDKTAKPTQSPSLTHAFANTASFVLRFALVRAEV